MPPPPDSHETPDPATAPDADAATPDAAAEPEEPTSARPLVKLLYLVLALAVFAAALRWTPLKDWLDDGQAAKEWFQGFGHYAWLIYILVCIVTLPVGMPRLFLCALGGMLFGFKLGLPLALTGTVLGAYVNFIGARFLGKTWGMRSARQSKKRLARSLDNPTLVGVFVMRQMPIYGHAVNVLLGLSRCGHGTFLLGTILGFLPQATVAVLVGSGVLKEDAMHAMKQMGSAIGVLAICGLIAVWVVRRYRANLGEPPSE